MCTDTESVSELMIGNYCLVIAKVIGNLCENNLNMVMKVKHQEEWGRWVQMGVELFRGLN